MLHRDFVYKAIDGERDYQDSLGPDRREDSESQHSVGDYLTMLSTYLRKAQDEWTNKPGVTPSLHQVRKLAAICVKCMEQHGAPKR